MPYDRQNLEVEWVFVCRHLYQLRQLGPICVLWWQNVARFLPWNVSNNHYASNLAVFLRQRLSELWTLNFDDCRICRGVSSNPCFNGGGKWVWTAHVFIDFGQGISELANIVQDADLIVLEGMGQMLRRYFNAHIEACCGESTLNP